MKRARVTEELAYGSALDRLTGGDRPEAETPRQRAAPPAAAPGASMIKLSVFLNHGEDAYLEGLSSTAKFSGGRKLSKTRIIEAMVRAFRETDLDVRGVRDDQELFRRVSAQLR
jgi:hypothetical protein